MKSSTQTFNISFPKELVSQIDAAAAKQFGSRSDFLRAAAVQYLKKEQEWEYIFREGKKIGESIRYKSEEEVAELIAAERRKSRKWL